MSEFRNLLGETIERLLADHATKETVQGAEEGTWPEGLWSALEENGLTRLMASEAQGGAGGTWGDALVLLRAQGRYAAPVPLAETMVAAWLLSEAGLDVPDGPLTLLTGVALSSDRSEEHTSELQSRQYLVCRLLLDKKTYRLITYNFVTDRAH